MPNGNLLGIPDVSPDLMVNPLMPQREMRPSEARRAGHQFLSPEQVYQYALKAGFSPDKARLMTAIALHESGGGDVSAYNPNDPHGGSYGLTQINGAHEGAESVMGNPQLAMDKAYQISKGGTDFTPWGSYNNGGYRQYLGVASGLGEGGPIYTPTEGPAQIPPVQWPAPTQYAAAPAGYGTGFVPGSWGGPPVPMGVVPTTTQVASADPGGLAIPGGMVAGGAVFNPPGPVNYPANPVGPFGVGGAFPQQVAQAQTGAAQGGAFGIPSAATQPGFWEGGAGGGAGGPSGPGTPASGQTVQMNPAQMPQISRSTAMFGMLAALAQGYRPVRINYDPFRVYQMGYNEPAFPSNVMGRLTSTESPTIQRTVQPPGGIQQEPSPYRRFTPFY